MWPHAHNGDGSDGNVGGHDDGHGDGHDDGARITTRMMDCATIIVLMLAAETGAFY